MVVRPNGRTVSVFQGKGVTPDAARASGVMEAIETHHAEHHRLDVHRADCGAMAGLAHADPRRLPRRRVDTWDPAAQVPWVEGWDLVDGSSVWVPLERVAVDYRRPLADGLGVFVQDSNGLASGNCMAEAMLHALYEAIERDARALTSRAAPHGGTRTAVDAASAGDAIVDGLVARCGAAGVSLALHDLTTDVGVPVIEAVLSERGRGPLPPLPPLRGYGCHRDSRVAVTRAITEAAQARLTIIAGSRDDLTASHYPTAEDRQRRARWLTRERRAVMPLRPGDAGTTVEEDLRAVLGALTSCGVESVVAVDLSPAGAPVAVVRVVVPALESYAGRRGYAPGQRARAAWRAAPA